MFDDAAIRPPAADAEHYRNPYRQNWPGLPDFAPQTLVADIVDDMVARGTVLRADSLGELAVALELPETALIAEVDRYNAFCAAGVDSDHGKPARFLLPVSTGPFYAAAARPSVVNVTAYGLRIDGEAQVVGGNGSPIPGLFAAGECTGGVFGARYIGSGNSLANCFTIGRVAGESAAAFAAQLVGASAT